MGVDNKSNSAMTARERVLQIREEMVQTLLEQIEKNPTKWEKGWNSIAAGSPYNGKTGTVYRGINALYLYAVGHKKKYSDPRWVTFNQAKELGASVKKGEKSAYILFFEYYDRATKKAFDSRTVEDMTDEERKAYLKENVYAVMKYSSVFNAEQCHNFPKLDVESLKMNEEERSKQNAVIESIIANSAAPITYDGVNQAYYSPGTDSIHLPQIEAFKTMQDYYATALHEIAHSTGHHTRLNREMGEGFGTEGYAKEELRAELACVFMQLEHGIRLEGSHITNHAAYLKSWLDAAKKDKSVFFKAAADAQKISDYISQNYMSAEAVAKHSKEQEEQTESAQKLAAARAEARRLVQETGEPYVTIEWSEHQALNSYDVMSLSVADKKLAVLDEQEDKNEGYYKTKLHIDYMFEGKPDAYENCRFDIGSEGGGLIHHIDDFLKADTLLDAEERAEVETAIEYFKRHLEISDYLASPEQLAELSEEEREDINEYIGRSRAVLNMTEPFSDYENKMPLKPDELKRARDAAHAAGLPFYEGTDEEFEEFENAGGLVYDGNMSVEDYQRMWELREQDEKLIKDAASWYSIERPELKPQDCLDAVREMKAETRREYAELYRAYLSANINDDSERTNYNFSASDLINAWHENAQTEENTKEKISVNEAREAMLNAQIKDVYHYAVRIGTMPYTDPEDGYESERPAQEIYVIDNGGRIELNQTLPIDGYLFMDSLPYGRTSRSYEQVEYEELEQIAAGMRAPIEAYKAALRAEKEQTENRRRSDAYYEQRAMDVLEEHYAAGNGAFVRELKDPKYLSGKLYSEQTRIGYPVLSIIKDSENRNIAIIKRNSDYMVAANYDTDDGTWGQGYYDFKDLKSAEDFRNENYGNVIIFNAEQREALEHGAEILDNLKTYDKWRDAQSPLLKDYLKVKYENPSYIVFYRLGDFYEVLGTDAEKAAKLLDLTLTGRDIGMKERIQMAGIPFSKMDEYAARLTAAGENVLFADGTNIQRKEAVNRTSTSTAQTLSEREQERYIYNLKINYSNELLLSQELAKLGFKRDLSVEEENSKRDEQAFAAQLTFWINDIKYTGENGKTLQGTYGKTNNGILIEPTDILRFTSEGLSQAEVKQVADILRSFDEHLTVKLDTKIQERQESKEQERTDKTSVQNRNDNRTLGDELAKSSVWLKINLPAESVGKEYGTNTLIRMPDGEYSHYALFVPTKFLKNNNGKTELRVSSDFKYRINNDGRQVELTGKELRDSFEGKQIGKEYKRVALSRQFAQVFANLEKNVPEEMKAMPNWCVYRIWQKSEDKRGKVIKSAVTGDGISKNEAGAYRLSDFTDFETAIKYAKENNFAGLSFLLQSENGITCIDLDKCVANAETGEMKEHAEKLVNELKGTYMERSTSGNGVHIFLKDDILRNGKYRDMVKDASKGDLEVLDNNRIISLTGDMFSETNALTRAGSAATVYLRQELGERKQIATNTAPRPTSSVNLSDRELIRWIQDSKKGSIFNDLYNGKLISGDKSNDDAKLANLLLYFNGGDKEQAFRIMRESGLNRPDKPDSYYRHTIDKIDEKITQYARRPNLEKNGGKQTGNNGRHGAQP